MGLTLGFVEVEQLLVGAVAIGGEVVNHVLGLRGVEHRRKQEV
jgi:hypothetical protein